MDGKVMDIHLAQNTDSDGIVIFIGSHWITSFNYFLC